MVSASTQHRTCSGMGDTPVQTLRGSHQVVHRYVLMVKDDVIISCWRTS